MTETSSSRRAALETHLRWVPLELVRSAEEGKGQRELKPSRVDHISSKFDVDLMGYPVVSERDGHFWILDGQARIGALKAWLGDWKGQQVQCRVFAGLTVEQEAEIFLELNDFTQVSAYAKFMNAVTAGRPVETDIDRIVRATDLLVSRDSSLDNTVSCVSTLIKVYRRGGPPIFARSLRVVRDAYGKPGMEAAVLDGVGLLCQRYNGELAEVDAVAKLGGVRGGHNGLLGRAQTIRKQTAAPLSESVAAAAVEIINAGKGGKKLKPWFKAATP